MLETPKMVPAWVPQCKMLWDLLVPKSLLPCCSTRGPHTPVAPLLSCLGFGPGTASL